MNVFTLHSLYAFILFFLGLVAGSLLNVIALRWPLGIPFSSPNLCPRCNSQLRFPDLIPLFSYLRLHGKCRVCTGKIHPRYPATELITATLWAWAGWNLASLPHHPVLNTLQGVLTLAFISAMILVALIDYDTHTIPDAITHIGLILVLLAAPILPQLHHAQTPETFSDYYPLLSYLLPAQDPWQHSIAATITGALTGFLLTALIYALGNVIFESRIKRAHADSALGVGDIKLMTFIGAFLGWKSVFVVVAVGAIMGACIGTMLKFHTGRARGQAGWDGLRAKWDNGIAIIPFGPFLAMGAILFLLAGSTFEKIFGL